MKFDASLPPVYLSEVPSIAKAAEEIGFDTLWTSETQHDPFLPCALIAEHSKIMKMGTAIAVSFSRSPANLAYTAWDLAAQSNGRFILGLGTQVKAHIERRFGMPWPESPVGKLREQIQVMRALWDAWQNGTKLNFRGEHYKITLMSPFFNPGPLPFLTPPLNATQRGLLLRGLRDTPKNTVTRPAEGEEGRVIPIYIAGVNTGLARLAGELCDGFHVHPFHSLRYLKEVILPALEQGARQANRDIIEIKISVTAFTATTPEEKNFARAQISFYASTPSYRPVMDLHGWTAAAEKLSAHASRGEWAEMPMLISDEMLNEFCVNVNEDRLAGTLKERYESIADHLTLYTPFVPGEKDEWWRKLNHSLKG